MANEKISESSTIDYIIAREVAVMASKGDGDMAFIKKPTSASEPGVYIGIPDGWGSKAYYIPQATAQDCAGLERDIKKINELIQSHKVGPIYVSNPAAENQIILVGSIAARDNKAAIRENRGTIYISVPNGSNSEVYFMPNEYMRRFIGVDLRDVAEVSSIIKDVGGKLIARIPYRTQRPNQQEPLFP